MTCLVDAHVHIYPEFDPGVVLASARDNAAIVARSAGLSEATPLMLLVTRTAREATPAEFFAHAGWHLSDDLDEPNTLRLTDPSGRSVLVVDGAQIVTTEGLEILSLGAPPGVPDRLPIEETIMRVTASGGLPVLPWGFGKWTGNRGSIARRIASDPKIAPLWLGDNSGRWARGGLPALLKEADNLGRSVLPGSDPLPLAGGDRTVGRLVFEADIDAFGPTPFGSLRTWLLDEGCRPVTHGRLTALPQFVRNQVGMQLRRFL